MNKKVLITGASGFIGRQAIDSLLIRGFEVHAISLRARLYRNNLKNREYAKEAARFSSNLADVEVAKLKELERGGGTKSSGYSTPAETDSSGCFSINSNFTWHQLDLMDQASITDFMKTHSFSHLLHFAWDATPGQYWTSMANLDWVGASLHLVRSFIQSGGERVVVSGTCAEYEWKEDIYCERTTPFNPSTLYGNAKRGLYCILEALCRQLNISFAWGYIFFLYGSYEHPKRFLPSIIRALLSETSVPCSQGTQIRDFMHVKDVADAFVALLDSNISGGVNIGSGRGISLRDIAKLVSQITGKEELLEFGALPTAENEPKCLVPNVSRLHSELQWEPKIELSEGIEQTVLWWKQNYFSNLSGERP